MCLSFHQATVPNILVSSALASPKMILSSLSSFVRSSYLPIVSLIESTPAFISGLLPTTVVSSAFSLTLPHSSRISARVGISSSFSVAILWSSVRFSFCTSLRASRQDSTEFSLLWPCTLSRCSLNCSAVISNDSVFVPLYPLSPSSLIILYISPMSPCLSASSHSSRIEFHHSSSQLFNFFLYFFLHSATFL